MKFNKTTLNIAIICILTAASIFIRSNQPSQSLGVSDIRQKPSEAHWFELQRQSNIENLYFGVPGDKEKSTHLRSFRVKTGIPGERPTPLPELVGREYWIITAKQPELNNPETAPYFITLDVPAPTEEPYGPVPYEECNGEQCHWILPGAFGLHGTGGNPDKLADWDLGSSGCIRHSDEEITYLYNLLEPDKEEIRYYIVDA